MLWTGRLAHVFTVRRQWLHKTLSLVDDLLTCCSGGVERMLRDHQLVPS